MSLAGVSRQFGRRTTQWVGARRLALLTGLAVAASGLVPQWLRSQTSPRPPSARSIVRQAEHAVDMGNAATLARAWRARAATSRLHRLGWATLARLAYDNRLADSLYATLVGPGTGPGDDIRLWAQVGQGVLLAQQWRSEAADSVLWKAAQDAEAARDRPAAVEALARLALIRGRTAGVNAGLALVDRADRLLPNAQPDERSLILTVRGQLLLARGDSAGTRVAADARALGRSAHLPRVEGLALQLMAHEELRRGRADSAIVLYGRSAALLKRVNEKVGYGVALQWRGFLERTLGDFGAARRDLEAALAIGDAAGALTLGWVELNLGEVSIALGDWGSAHQHLSAARSRLGAVGDQWGTASALTSEALVRRATRDWAASDSMLDAAERIMIASGNVSSVIPVRVRRLQNAISRRDWTMASRLLARARDSALSTVSEAQLDVDYYEALIALGQGRARDALRVLVPPGRRAFTGGYQRVARTAEAYALASRADSAEAWARAAFVSLDRWRDSQPREARLAIYSISGDAGDPDVGFATVISALAADGRVEAAFEFAERLASRELLIAMVRRDALRVDAGDQPVAHPIAGRAGSTAAAAARPIALKELQAALPDSAAVVEFVTGTWGEPTTALIVTSSRVRSVALTPADSLIAPVNQFRAALQTGVWPRPLARRLGDQLLSPVVAALPAGITRLQIVGGTVLQVLPFDALELSDGRAAVERYEISYAPSASVAALLAQRARDAAGDRGLLTLGASERPRGTGHAMWDSLPRLPGAAREARRIAGFFVKRDVLEGVAATEAALKGRAGQTASVVHLAAHAVVDPSAMGETALLLSPGAGEDGILRPEEIGAMTLAADVVVLSACRTTRADVSFGDEGFRGLVTPMLEAGARSIVATAWPVDDAKQVALMDRFYRELASGAPAGAALRTAKLASFRAGGSPREWASLVLWGDALAKPAARMRKPLLSNAILGLGSR